MYFVASMANTNRIARPKPIAERPVGSFTIAATALSKTLPRPAGFSIAVQNRWVWPCSTMTMDGWPDLLVANDTQPNKLYRNAHNGTFKDVAVEAGIAFSADGKARAGMGVDAADFDNSGSTGVAITNFDNEMIGLYRAAGNGTYEDIATQSGVGLPSKTTLGFGCMFADLDLDGALDLIAANGHIDNTVRSIRGNVGYAQPPQLFLNSGKRTFRDISSEVGDAFRQPKVGRGLAYGDFDRDGDLDILMTTNNGPAYLYRNDQSGRKPQHPLSFGWKAIEPRRDRRSCANLLRRHRPISHGEKRIKLSVTIRTAGNFRSGKAR